jgi:cysteine sulfinate desulfinase/cysteine desulfurase-like protein
VPHIGNLHCEGGKIGPHGASEEVFAKRHIVTSQVEHSSVLNYRMALEKAKPRFTTEHTEVTGNSSPVCLRVLRALCGGWLFG